MNIQQPHQILELLKSIALDELKILETVCPGQHTNHYRENRQMLAQNYNAMSPEAYRDYLSSIRLPYIKVEKILL